MITIDKYLLHYNVQSGGAIRKVIRRLYNREKEVRVYST